jgi:hypothetical protein
MTHVWQKSCQNDFFFWEKKTKKTGGGVGFPQPLI